MIDDFQPLKNLLHDCHGRKPPHPWHRTYKSSFITRPEPPQISHFFCSIILLLNSTPATTKGVTPATAPTTICQVTSAGGRSATAAAAEGPSTARTQTAGALLPKLPRKRPLRPGPGRHGGNARACIAAVPLPPPVCNALCPVICTRLGAHVADTSTCRDYAVETRARVRERAPDLPRDALADRKSVV